MFLLNNKNYTFWLFIFLSERKHFDKNMHPKISKRSYKKEFPLPHVRILYSKEVGYKILYSTGEIKRLSN